MTVTHTQAAGRAGADAQAHRTPSAGHRRPEALSALPRAAGPGRTARRRGLPLGGVCGRIRRAGALLGACLVLVLAALSPAPAAGQSETTLISNIGQGSVTTIRNTQLDRAQPFTTGSNSLGYTLSSIDVVSADAQGDTFDVRLCTVNSQGYVSTASTCTTLTRPGSFAAGTLTFTASPAIELDANTTYTIHLTNLSSVHLGRTMSDAEDAGGAAGWSLDDSYDFLSDMDVWGPTTSGTALRVAVKGTVKTPETITIEALEPTVTARADWINFELARTGDTAAALDVTVTLAPPAGNDWAIPMANLTQDVTFAAGEATATLSVGAFAGGFGELGIANAARMRGTLTASLGTLTGYDTTDTAEVEVLALDGPLWVASLDESSLVFTEEGGSQNVVIELRAQHAEMGAPVANADRGSDARLAMALIGNSGSARSGTDFAAVSENLDAHDGVAYRRGADGHMVGRLNVPVSVTSDTDDEGTETFTLRLSVSFSSGTDVLEVRGPDGTLADFRVSYTATIRDTPDGHIEDQLAVVGTSFSYAVPSGAFAHLGSSLSYSARRFNIEDYDDTAFPSWLSFTASSATFSGTPGTGDVGRMKVEVTATATGGASDSEIFEVVVSAKPSISGVGRVGEVLTAVTGATGTFTYQWVRVQTGADVDIAGETGATYTLTASELGNKVKVKVTYGSGMNATTITSDAWPPHANVQPASVGMVSVGGRREVWSGTLTVGAQVVGPLTEAIAHGWATDVGRLTQVDARIELGTNAYKIGQFVMLYEQDGDLADLMVMTPGSLVFSLVGFDDDRRSTGATRQLTAQEKAALRLHVGDKTLHFADANELDWGHYEWQTPDLVWTPGDSIPLALSTPAAFMQPCGALPNEIWCATMTVGDSTAGTLGYIAELSALGSLSAPSFTHAGTQYETRTVVYQPLERRLSVQLAPAEGAEVFNALGYAFHAGVAQVDAPATQIDTGLGTLGWKEVPNPGWADSDQVVVRLTGPGSSQQEADPPTIEGLPAIGGVGTNSVWDAGDTLSVTLTFSEEVEVDETNGTPTVSFDLGGTKPRTASYESGSGTTELVFEYDVVEADGSNSLVSMTGNNVALNGGTIRSVASGTDADLTHQGVLVLGANAAPRSDEAPRVTLDNLPRSHDGSSPFTLELAFSGPPQGLRAKSDASSVLAVTGGSVDGARDVSVNGQTRWEVTIDPAGAGEVRVEVPARECTETGAVCINGRGLEDPVEGTVPGPPAGPEAIVATWANVPEEHDGATTFTVQLDFSRNPRGFSYRWLTSSVLSIEGGAVSRVWRRVKGRHDGWGLDITPSGNGAVTLTVNPTTSCEAPERVCTADGGRLEQGAQAVIAGPAALTVADARVEETEGATLDFVVTMSRARGETTTVAYATSDGTARSGDDYTAASGTLTFAPGDTEKTVEVAVLNDAHDEGEETMTLTLSSAVGARIEDGTATGTIENTDPMPKAWMARFGRTVGTQVVDALNARLDGASASHVTVGGIRLSGQTPEEEPEAQTDDPFALPAWATQSREAGAQTMSGRELLLGSAFSPLERR